MILQIELLSDLCVSSGETYNSYVDTDIVYDEYGLPYVPAKRIKGCIREAALELVEWELFPNKVYESLFGKEGAEQSKFSLDNAYLRDYSQLVEDLTRCEDRTLVHPQRVLGLYTYARTQTALTENGVADGGSLRTIRVANKGLVFEAALKENHTLTTQELDFLKQAIAMVKHIGISRTRGLGLVEMTLSEKTENESRAKKTHALYGFNKINYIITLKAPILCKSAAGCQEKTHDYIEGSKILGVLAQNLSKEAFCNLMRYGGEGESIIVSNAYICKDGERCTPIRASLQKQKDQTYDITGELKAVDMLVPCSDDAQWTPIGAAYANDAGYVSSVSTEINYHHRRPKDKSIGKATGTDDSAFYQLESICKGQQFAGYILADEEQAETILSVFENLQDIRMGANRNTEYGNVELIVTSVESVEKTKTDFENDFIVKLNAPAILYNDSGMPVADVECLKRYIADLLGEAESTLKIKSAFLTYETLGGFNVTWHRRKPIFTALGKGTVCHMVSEKKVDVSLLQGAFIGERASEGYGELEISTNIEASVTLRKSDVSAGIISPTEHTDILPKLRQKKNMEMLSQAGVLAANELLESNKRLFQQLEFNAALSKLIMIVKAESSLDAALVQITEIESVQKREICTTLIKKAQSSLKQYHDLLLNADSMTVFMHSFLSQIKYKTYRKGGKL